MIASAQKESVEIWFGSAHVQGTLELPPDPIGVVLFAHGSGSSRFSPRNNYVARELRNARIATLLMDLLTTQEEQDTSARFDISLLTQRLNGAIDWLRDHGSTKALPIGLFGASTGAAATLRVAGMRKADIAALVSRGGRTDLAGSHVLTGVCAPTLLIVGGLDVLVINLNRITYDALRCEKRLEMLDGASHLFEEPGKLEAVASLATSWFAKHLTRIYSGSISAGREHGYNR